MRNEGGTILSLFTDHRMTATSRLQFNEPMTGHFEIGGSRSTGNGGLPGSTAEATFPFRQGL